MSYYYILDCKENNEKQNYPVLTEKGEACEHNFIDLMVEHRRRGSGGLCREKRNQIIRLLSSVSSQRPGDMKAGSKFIEP